MIENFAIDCWDNIGRAWQRGIAELCIDKADVIALYLFKHKSIALIAMCSNSNIAASENEVSP